MKGLSVITITRLRQTDWNAMKSPKENLRKKDLAATTS